MDWICRNCSILYSGSMSKGSTHHGADDEPGVPSDLDGDIKHNADRTEKHSVPGQVDANGLGFGPVAPGHEPGSRTARIALFAVGVPGVPSIHLEEALWTCGEILRTE